MAAKGEIQKLKDAWRADPIWDLYETEGFELYRDELKAYQEKWESIWESRRVARLIDKAEKMGIPNNLDLAKYIDNLEYTIQKLQDEIHQLKENLHDKA